jgi:hypothetical protein
MDNSRTPNIKPSNSFVVAPAGGDYTDVALAISAALVSGASTSNPYVIKIMPGIFWVPTTNLPPGVLVEWIPKFTPRQGVPLYGPWNGISMVALRCDDFADDWFTDNVGGVGASINPFEYCQANGIPVTLGGIYDNIGKAGANLTAAEIRTMVWEGGFEIAAHSYYHLVETDATHKLESVTDVYNEIERLPKLFNELAVVNPTGGAANTLGIDVAGFFQPGVWIGAGNINSNYKELGSVGKAIQEKYEWSGANNNALMASGAEWAYKHFTAYSSYTNVADYVTQITALSATVNGQPMRKVLLFHAIPSNFKTIVDTIVALRTAGKLMPVTCSELFNGVSITGAGNKCLIPNGEIDSWTTGNIGNFATIFGAYYLHGGSGTNTVEDAGSGVKWLQLTANNGYVMVTLPYLQSKHGRSMTIRFRAKAIGGAQNIKINVSASAKGAMTITLGATVVSGKWKIGLVHANTGVVTYTPELDYNVANGNASTGLTKAINDLITACAYAKSTDGTAITATLTGGALPGTPVVVTLSTGNTIVPTFTLAQGTPPLETAVPATVTPTIAAAADTIYLTNTSAPEVLSITEAEMLVTRHFTWPTWGKGASAPTNPSGLAVMLTNNGGTYPIQIKDVECW